MDYKEFAGKIKTKYPQYADMDDMDLAKRMVAKYPQYSDVTFDTIQQPESQPERSFMQKAGDIAMQNIRGVVDPVVSSVTNAYKSVTEADDKDVERMQQASTTGEKILAGAGSLARDIGDVAAVPFNAGLGIAKNAKKGFEDIGVLPDKQEMDMYKEAVKPVVDWAKNTGTAQAIKTSAKFLGEKIAQAPSWLKDIIDIGLNVPLGAVVGKVGTKAVTKAAEGAGEGLEGLGKRAYSGDLKINKPVSRKAYGKSLKDKQNTIVNTIFDEGLDAEGSFEKAYSKGRQIADQLDEQSKQIINAASNGDQVLTINPVKIIEDVGNKQATSGAWGTQENAKGIVARIVEDARAAGYDTEMPLSGLIEAKKQLDDGSVFSNGARLVDADRINQQVRKAIYLDMVDKAAEIAEKSGAGNLRDLGKRQKKLIDALSALDDAAYRVEKKNTVSLTDAFLGGGGLSLTAQQLLSGNLKGAAGTAAGTVAVIGGKKLLEQGRGASKIARAGRALQESATKDLLSSFKKSNPNVSFNTAFNSLKKQGYNMDRAKLFKMWKQK